MCPALCTYSGALAAWTAPERLGRLFEVAVGAVLTRLPGNLYYWREADAEVDFVYEGDKTFAIEVKSGKAGTAKGMERFLEKYPDAMPVFITPENYGVFEAASEEVLEKMR